MEPGLAIASGLREFQIFMSCLGLFSIIFLVWILIKKDTSSEDERHN